MLTNHVVPRSTATNLYDLLNDVCRVVTDEPKRVYMPDVVRAFRNKKDAQVRIHSDHSLTTVIKDGPACGTVGCIAGWMKVLTRTDDKEMSGVSLRQSLTLINMTRLFGSPFGSGLGSAADSLFTQDFPDDLTYGTRAYARHVVRNIRAFQKKHKAELLTKGVRFAVPEGGQS